MQQSSAQNIFKDVAFTEAQAETVERKFEEIRVRHGENPVSSTLTGF